MLRYSLPEGVVHYETTERAKDIGMSVPFTKFLGIAELSGDLGLVFGVLTQLAAFGLNLLMGGAIYKKGVVRHTGFWGEVTHPRRPERIKSVLRPH
jgi:putative oxidoreductase